MTAADVLTIAKKAGACERGLGYFDEYRQHTGRALVHSSAADFWLWLSKYDKQGHPYFMYAYHKDMVWCLKNLLVWTSMSEGEIVLLLKAILDTKRKQYDVWVGNGCVLAIWDMDIAAARAICKALARAYSE